MAFPPSLWPSRLLDQNFGMCITSNDFILPFYNTYRNYYRPWKWSTQSVIKDFGSTINNDNESFKVILDVQHFQPNELIVKVANNQILVEGRHEERKDEHSFVSRQFTRRYALPNNCMPEDVTSSVSSDGVLTVIANKKCKELPKNEKIVPIKLCETCPLKEAGKTVSADQKDKSAEKNVVAAEKKNKQIMVKEDHCCLLLKPELLRDAVSDCSEIITEKKKEQVEQQKQKVCQAGKNTSEILEQNLAKSGVAMSVTGEKCDKAAMSRSVTEEHEIAKPCASISASGVKFDKVNEAMSSGKVLEETTAKSSAAMSSSDEKFDLFDNTAASEKIFEKAGQSSMTKSEISECTSTSSKTSESIQCSTSYKASVTSNIKEISDFVSDILSSELDKTLDMKK